MRMCRSRYFEVGSQLSLIPEKRVYGMDDDRRLEVAIEDLRLVFDHIPYFANCTISLALSSKPYLL